MADLIITNQIDRNQRFAFFEVDNTLAAILNAAGIASYAPKKTAPKVLLEWSTCRTVSGVPFIQHRVGASVSLYDGPAAGAKREFPACPQAIIDELADAQKQAITENNNAVRAAEQAQNRRQK